MSVRIIRPTIARGRLHAPPSKSYTHRALVAAFLTGRPCRVVRPLDSDDTRATRDGLLALGARIRTSTTGWTVSPTRQAARRTHCPIHCGESGTTLRLLSAVATLGAEPITFEGAPQLATRPMGELFGALRQLGATVQCPPRGRALPCTVQGPIHSGDVTLRGDVSSQFTSALLMVLPTVEGRSTVRIEGPTVSQPYVEATCAVLRDRGVRVQRTPTGFDVPGDQRYHSGPIQVPGDASSAAYLWAAGAASGGSVEVTGVSTKLPQADLAILSVLSKMGAHVDRASGGIRVSGPLSRPVDVDLTGSPDLFPLVAVLAALVPKGRSRLFGAPHLQFKESNRRAQSVRLARAMGADVSETPARVQITGTPVPRPFTLSSLHDHRLVMSAAVAGLEGSGPSHVGEAEAVSKSFPGFWDAFGALTRSGERGP